MDDLAAIDYSFNKEKRYYNPITFPILAPLFSFIFPSILYGINIKNSGDIKKGNRTILLSIISGIVFFAIVFISADLFEKYIPNGSEYIFEGLNIAIGINLYTKQKTI